MCDCDPPSVYSERERTARKEHRCYECHSTIAIGMRYMFVSGVWDGSGASFKLCLACHSLHEDFRAGDEEGCGAPFSRLGEMIEGSGDERLVARWRAVLGVG